MPSSILTAFRAKLVIGLCGIALGSATAARASMVFDQVNLADVTKGQLGGSPLLEPTFSSLGVSDVQTFTVGRDGLLNGIRLQLFAVGQHGVLHASLYEGDYAKAEGAFGSPGVVPSPGVLVGQFTKPVATVPGLAGAQLGQLVSFDTLGLNYNVHVGQVLSLLVGVTGTAGDSVDWVNGYIDPTRGNLVGLNYAGGYNSASFDGNGFFIESTYDRGFETVVNVADPVPEPATWSLTIFGFGLAGAALRRRRTNFSVLSVQR